MIRANDAVATTALPTAASPSSTSKSPDDWTRADSDSLQQCETRIAYGERSFWHSGFALRQIQENRLYRKSHETFDHYVHDRWDMSPAHAYRLIADAKLMKRLAESLPFGEKDLLPARESHARELSRLPDKDQVRAWREIVHQSRDQGVGITARLIGQKVDEILQIAERRPKRPKAQTPEQPPIRWKQYRRKIAAFTFEFDVSHDELAQQVHDAALVWHRQKGVDREEAAAILNKVAQKLLTS